MRFSLKMLICARTVARIWRNIYKEHKDPKMRGHTNLQVRNELLCFVCASECVRVVRTLSSEHICLCIVCACVHFRPGSDLSIVLVTAHRNITHSW